MDVVDQPTELLKQKLSFIINYSFAPKKLAQISEHVTQNIFQLYLAQFTV